MSKLQPDTHLIDKIFASPNYNERKASIEHIILHYTGMNTQNAALKWLCDPSSQVSAHYFITEAGKIYQLVAEEKRAWHAGISYWKGQTDLNSSSIGIEIANSGHCADCPPYPPEQIKTLISLCHDIIYRNMLNPHNILAHSDIAPQRKQDPGEHFPWDALAKGNLGHWVEPEPIIDGKSLAFGDTGNSVGNWQKQLMQYGFNCTITKTYDEFTSLCTTAFQRHHRPYKIDGKADKSTINTLEKLLKL